MSPTKKKTAGWVSTGDATKKTVDAFFWSNKKTLNHLGMAVGSRKFQSLQRDWLWYSLNAWRVEAEKMKGLQAPSN